MQTMIYAFFVGHWLLAVFFQSFFHHRYGAHRQFTMSKRTERVFHFLSWFVGGPSYLSPRAYAILHRMHHAYSDTPKDPHSPIAYPNFFKMMWRTKGIYQDIKNHRVEPEARFEGGYPEWKLLDEDFNNYPMSILWGVLYTIPYLLWADHWWLFLALPFHYYMGPTHGAIVNWFGHKLGYKSFDNGDNSKNTLVFDVLTMGELFQNNHHKFGMRPNFAVRWFEIDPTWQVMRVLSWLGIVDLGKRGKTEIGPEAVKPAA